MTPFAKTCASPRRQRPGGGLRPHPADWCDYSRKAPLGELIVVVVVLVVVVVVVDAVVVVVVLVVVVVTAGTVVDQIVVTVWLVAMVHGVDGLVMGDVSGVVVA